MGIVTSHGTEIRRLAEQVRLDELKSAAERNKWGQFATPPDLALSLARYACQQAWEEPIRFLDPAIGTGSFFSAITAAAGQHKIESAVGIELDPLFVKSARSLWSDTGLDVIKGDFTKQTPDRRFNLVLTNPPYVRHHHLAAADKARLKDRLSRSLQMEISGLAGLYCYFMLLSHDWLEEHGFGIWLVPSEFMDVNYGDALRRYLTEKVTLLHIHRFCPKDVQFTDALVSSAVVVFRKTLPPIEHHARFSFGGPIENPQCEASIALETLKHSRKWSQFPAKTTSTKSDGLKLGDIFAIKRGLATGSNDFFIVDSDKVKEHSIPRRFLKPILPGPRNLPSNIVEALEDGAPCVSPQLYLIDCSEPQAKIKERWPRFYAYLKRGRAQGIHSSYLSSHRNPWYSQEQRPPAPFLCTYMGRSRDGRHPFRFIWNQSNATAHNVYLLLYPTGQLRKAMEDHPELQSRVFQALQAITSDQLVSEGRVYGGGLHKVEPKELAQINAEPILESIEAYVRMEQQRPLFD